MQSNYDKVAQDKIDSNINLTVPWYLMAAWAYYEDDDPILSDFYFDNLARKIMTHWDKIEHMHKDFISKDDLEAGTFLGKYPSRVKGAVKTLRSIDV